MSVKKSTIAKIAAACGVVAVLGGGYVASLVSYSSMLDQAALQVQKYLNTTFADPLSGEEAHFSVDFSEPKFGIWDHDLIMVVVNDDDHTKVRLPLTVSTSYMGYEFDFDLVHATIDDENILKSYDFSSLTALESKGSYGLWSNEFAFSLKTSYLNDLEKFAEQVAHAKTIDWLISTNDIKQESSLPELFEKKKTELLGEITKELKEESGCKDVGTLTLEATVDTDENVKFSLEADSLANSMALWQDLRVFSHHQGVESFKSIGRTDVAAKKLHVLTQNGYTSAQDVVMQTASSRVTKDGKFDLNFKLNIGAVEDVRDLHTSGTLENLNLSLFNADSFAWSLAHYLDNTPVTLRFDKDSGFGYSTTLKEDKYSKGVSTVVPVTFSGALTSNAPAAASSDNVAAASSDDAAPAAASGDAAAAAPAADAAEATSLEKVSPYEPQPVFTSDFDFAIGADVNQIDEAWLKPHLKQLFKIKDGTSTCRVHFELDDHGGLSVQLNGEQVQ